MNKQIGAIFLLIASILYATDQICHSLTHVAMSNFGISIGANPVNNWLTIILACISAILGIFFILKGIKNEH